MAVVKMQKIRLYVHRNAVSDVLHAVQKLGIVEFVAVQAKAATSDDEQEASVIHHASGRLDFAVKFLTPFAPKQSLLSILRNGTKMTVSDHEIKKIADEFHYNDIIDKLEDLEEARNDTIAKREALREEQALLSEWAFVDTSLHDGLETAHTKTFLLRGKEDALDSFLELLEKEHLLSALARGDATHLSITSLKESSEIILRAARESDLELAELPRTAGTPQEILARLIETDKELAARLSACESEIREFLPYLPKLKVASDYLFWQKNKHELIDAATRTESVRVFEGWCPKSRLYEIESAIKYITSGFAIESIAPNEGELPPVEIKNNRFIQPFEAVTRLYGLPSSHDLDPTVFLAIFFFVFFGFSLPDVGHGLVISLLMFLVLLFVRLPKTIKPLITLLAICGLGAAGAGLLFGDYFGVEADKVSPALAHLRIFNPIASPLVVLGVALGLGMLQIMFGLFLKIVVKAKQGDLIGGLLEQVPWLSLFSAIIALVASKGGVLGGPAQYYTWWIYGSLAAIVLTAGHHEHGIAKKLMHGFVGLYHGVNFLSDLLSYSRIFALGLAAAALAFAVNLIAGLVTGIPHIGVALMILILVVGQTFALGIGALVAFVHSARLQFVEFFGKFIAGTGRKFSPFARQERNIVISD